jgi:hypothetical protein
VCHHLGCHSDLGIQKPDRAAIQPSTSQAAPGSAATTSLSPIIALPILLVSSTLVLLIGMGVIAMVFAGVKLVDPTQPLGLPAGSIQSLIALSLVMIFMISGVYLFAQLQTPDVSTLTNVTSEQMAQFSTRIVGIRLMQSGAQPLYQVDVRNDMNQAAVDMAKQIMTMIGTLLVTVVGFYFGSRSTAAAVQQGAGAGQPAVTVTPTPVVNIVPTPPATNLAPTPTGGAPQQGGGPG